MHQPTPAPQQAPTPTAPNDELVRVRLDIAYDGTDFHGWARQGSSDLRTVQGCIEDALALIARQPCPLTVAGRTDAGVHAAGQVAHVDLPTSFLHTRSMGGQVHNLVRRLGKLLDEDVRILDASIAPEGFDARFSALARTYHYRVSTNPAGALPTRSRDTAVWNAPIDLDLANQAAARFIGLNDFAAVCKHKEGASTIRTLHTFHFEDISTPFEPQLYQATVSADAFCWNMVRCLVGASLSVAQGRYPLELIDELLHATERDPRVPLSPARGLSLVAVSYPPAHELAARASITRAKRTVADLKMPRS